MRRGYTVPQREAVSDKRSPMLKKISLFGMIVALGLAGILFVGTPRATQVMAREEVVRTEPCPLVDAVVDEGYGVARHTLKPVCKR